MRLNVVWIIRTEDWMEKEFRDYCDSRYSSLGSPEEFKPLWMGSLGSFDSWKDKIRDCKNVKVLTIRNNAPAKELIEEMPERFSKYGIHIGFNGKLAYIYKEQKLFSKEDFDKFTTEVRQKNIEIPKTANWIEYQKYFLGLTSPEMTVAVTKQAITHKKAISKLQLELGLRLFVDEFLKPFLDTPIPLEADNEVGSEGNKKNVKLDVELVKSVNGYNAQYSLLKDSGEQLFIIRNRAIDLITHIEFLINSITNQPKTFETAFAEIKQSKQVFIDTIELAKEELSAARGSAISASIGVAGGAAIATLTPTVAVWVATTYGTASTGTAISALSGAAAQKAVLAWLGGGALSIGGGGTAAGEAFLAMAGPIGWVAAGLSILTSLTIFEIKKMKIDKQRKDAILKINSNTDYVKREVSRISQVLHESNGLFHKTADLYKQCLFAYGRDFNALTEEQVLLLGTLVNNTKSLSKHLQKTLEDK